MLTSQSSKLSKWYNQGTSRAALKEDTWQENKGGSEICQNVRGKAGTGDIDMEVGRIKTKRNLGTK